MDFLDVNQSARIKAMKDNNVRLMIHGHVRKLGIHTHIIDGTLVKRVCSWSLGQWIRGVITCSTNSNITLHAFGRIPLLWVGSGIDEYYNCQQTNHNLGKICERIIKQSQSRLRY